MSFPNEQHRSEEAAAQAAFAAEAASGDQSESAETEALKASVAAAEARAAEQRDLYLRALAELQNVQKRATRDVEQAHKYAVERFANDLIAVKDSLELGLSAAGNEPAVESLRAGTEATLKLLAKAFEKAGITEIVPQGQTFNPELHEAMVMQPSNEQAPNTVLQVVQKGYQLNGRLLRPARVVVAKAAE